MAWYRTGGGKPEEEKSVTAETSAVTVTPSQGKTMKKVTVSPTPTQSKTITPSETQQTVEPDSGKHLASVIVSGDANLKAENIKKDVAIFGKTGTVTPVEFEETGMKELWKFTGHTNYVRAVAVDANGNVYSGSADKTVRKISSSGQQVWSFTGHTDRVNAVAVDASGNVYSGSNDKTVRKIKSNVNAYKLAYYEDI